MPIYEFYCKKCHTIYKFFSRTVNTEKIPKCPNCKNITLKRNISLFSSISSRKENRESDVDMSPLDESKMEKALSMLAHEAGKNIEEDPRHATELMRKFSDATGFKMGSGMEEALSRLEKGEDPDKIEKEMGDILQEEEPFHCGTQGKKGKQKPKPKVDETLYEL
jgi:putative FmdB family regulatory protein